MYSYPGQLTRLPNHWWASSCPTTSATSCLDAAGELSGSTSNNRSLENAYTAKTYTHVCNTIVLNTVNFAVLVYRSRACVRVLIPVGDEAPVLHGSSSKVRDGNQIHLGKRIGDTKVVRIKRQRLHS